jgi:hypothetical protein
VPQHRDPGDHPVREGGPDLLFEVASRCIIHAIPYE